MPNESTTETVQNIFAIRDTALGKDIATGIFVHDGEACAWLANYCCALKRITFELYRVGSVCETDGELSVTSRSRAYVCSATPAILDSAFDRVEDLLDDEKSNG